jgi:hypothetical protein
MIMFGKRLSVPLMLTFVGFASDVLKLGWAGVFIPEISKTVW